MSNVMCHLLKATRHLIVHLKKEAYWLDILRMRQIGYQFEERGKLAGNFENEVNLLSIWRKSLSTTKIIHPTSLSYFLLLRDRGLMNKHGYNKSGIWWHLSHPLDIWLHLDHTFFFTFGNFWTIIASHPCRLPSYLWDARTTRDSSTRTSNTWGGARILNTVQCILYIEHCCMYTRVD